MRRRGEGEIGEVTEKTAEYEERDGVGEGRRSDEKTESEKVTTFFSSMGEFLGRKEAKKVNDVEFREGQASYIEFLARP